MGIGRTQKIAIVSCLGLLLSIPASAQSPRKTSSKSSSTHYSTAPKTTKSRASSTAKHSSHTTAKHSSRSTPSTRKAKGKTTGSWRTRGQQGIDGARAREIQTALINSHYLDGQPSGVWDARSKAAMEKFQGDNGWQTKKIPDARALIKLGLGPDHANLINPETAYIQKPEAGKGGSPQN